VRVHAAHRGCHERSHRPGIGDPARPVHPGSLVTLDRSVDLWPVEGPRERRSNVTIQQVTRPAAKATVHRRRLRPAQMWDVSRFDMVDEIIPPRDEDGG
jgi:hypothetical protein